MDPIRVPPRNVRITVLCVEASVVILWITSHMYRRDFGSIPVDGSSRKITGGLPMVAMATLSLRR